MLKLASFLAGAAACAALAADPPEGPAAGEPADGLMADVVARLPQEPLMISGTLHVRRLRGVPVQDLDFTMRLNWGATPATAAYAISRPGGPALEELTITRVQEGVTRYDYTLGDPPVIRPMTNLAVSVQATDMSWVDLTLSFLWWRGGKIVGRDEVRGRPAIVADLPAPQPAAAQPYATVRVWVDEQARMLLRAEGYGPDAKPVRSLWVKSFRKINGRWMIKDIEVQRYPAQHMTKLTVREVLDEKGAPLEAGTEETGAAPEPEPDAGITPAPR